METSLKVLRDYKKAREAFVKADQKMRECMDLAFRDLIHEPAWDELQLGKLWCSAEDYEEVERLLRKYKFNGYIPVEII